MKAEVKESLEAHPEVRLSHLLSWLGVSRSSWYARSRANGGAAGRPAQPIAAELEDGIRARAKRYPWWGYKRIAVICRREGLAVSDRMVYKVMRKWKLLQKRRSGSARAHQACKLFELLPKGINELWQTDVTYIHVPGHGWWYAVTVIDYFSRYLLSCHFTPTHRGADLAAGLAEARQEAERLSGPLRRAPVLVTDNGSGYLSKVFQNHIRGRYEHVRIAYRTPQQLGLLERFHQTLKNEEVYWRLYRNPGAARRCLKEFRRRYNEVRPHWALRPVAGGDPVTPHQVYVQGQSVGLPKWQGWARAAKRKLQQLEGADRHLPIAAEPVEIAA